MGCWQVVQKFPRNGKWEAGRKIKKQTKQYIILELMQFSINWISKDYE
jgi:hypothetical protein